MKRELCEGVACQQRRLDSKLWVVRFRERHKHDVTETECAEYELNDQSGYSEASPRLGIHFYATNTKLRGSTIFHIIQ